jgi:hypothetical protein
MEIMAGMVFLKKVENVSDNRLGTDSVQGILKQAVLFDGRST